MYKLELFQMEILEFLQRDNVEENNIVRHVSEGVKSSRLVIQGPHKQEKNIEKLKWLNISLNLLAQDFTHHFKLKCAKLAGFVEIANWRVLSYLTNILCEPWINRLTVIYHEI